MKKSIKIELSLKGLKHCPRCKSDLPLCEFHNNKRNSDGKNAYCKPCVLKSAKIRSEDPIVKEKHRVSCSFRYYKDRDSILEQRRIDYAFGGEAVVEKNRLAGRAWRAANIDKSKEYHRDYYEAHKEEIIKANNAYSKARSLVDPVFNLLKQLRVRQGHVLRGRIKAGHTVDLLGMRPEDWKSYLESTFWPGMDSSNYGRGKGRWEVDHIIPLEFFDKSDPSWQFTAFHWSNTQALWRDDNRTKSHRLDWSHTESCHELPERLKRLDKTYWSVILEHKGQTI
jgi:hypothetical protein